MILAVEQVNVSQEVMKEAEETVVEVVVGAGAVAGAGVEGWTP